MAPLVARAEGDPNTSTAKPWMNAVAPLARPLFAWSHDRVMRWGEEWLARELGVPLLAST